MQVQQLKTRLLNIIQFNLLKQIRAHFHHSIVIAIWHKTPRDNVIDNRSDEKTTNIVSKQYRPKYIKSDSKQSARISYNHYPTISAQAAITQRQTMIPRDHLLWCIGNWDPMHEEGSPHRNSKMQTKQRRHQNNCRRVVKYMERRKVGTKRGKF